MERKLPLLEISGSALEKGRVHGETFKIQIQNLLLEYFLYLETKSKYYGLEVLTKSRALEISNTFVEPTEQYSPELIEEVRGISDAADVAFNEVFCLNAFLDLFDYLSPPFVQSGCTSLMVPGDMDGKGALIAQNYDLPAFFAPAAVLLRIVDSLSSAILYTSAGIVGCSGLNESGIGVVINNLVPADSGPGVPYPFVIRKVLSTKRIGDAIDAVGSVPRASGMNYVLCDKNGEIYNLETTAKDYEVICPFDGPLAHSNHYLTERLKSLESRAKEDRGQSILRWGRATRLLKRLPTLDSEALQQILCDRVNSPMAICRHDDNGCVLTICGIVLSPPEGRAWFVRGPSSDYDWVEYKIPK